MDLRLPPRHHVRRRDEADGAVQPYGIVVVHVLLNQAPRVLQRQRRSGPNALRFERFVPAFNFSVRLRIVGRRPDVGHARDTDEFFEVPRDELGTVVGDDPRPRLGVFLLGSLEYDFDVRLRHRLTQIQIRLNSLKPRAMNWGPLSEMTRGRASGCFSLAPSSMISMSASVIASRRSQWTMDRLWPSSTLHK